MDPVREVLFQPKISRIPCAPNFLCGVAGFRGGCLPVIELTQFLELEDPAPADSRPRFRVVVLEQEQSQVGLLADSVEQAFAQDLHQNDSGTVSTPTTDQTGIPFHFLHLERFLSLLEQKTQPLLPSRP